MRELLNKQITLSAWVEFELLPPDSWSYSVEIQIDSWTSKVYIKSSILKEGSETGVWVFILWVGSDYTENKTERINKWFLLKSETTSVLNVHIYN